MIITKYTLIRFLKKPVSFTLACVVPLILMFIPVIWQGEGWQMGFALLTFVVMGSGFITSKVILTDRLDGVVTRIMTAPVSRFRYLSESLVATTIPIIIQLVLVSLAGIILLNWDINATVYIFICYTFLAMASVALSFAWYNYMKSHDSSTGGLSFMITLMAMVSGMFMPLEIMPGILEWVGAIFPVYWGVMALQDIVYYGVVTTDYLIGVGVMILFTLLFLIIGGSKKHA